VSGTGKYPLPIVGREHDSSGGVTALPVSSAATAVSWGVRFIDPLEAAAPELIPGLLPAEGATYVCGPTNVGKSLVAIEIASALTTGQPLWGYLRASRRIGRVVYLLGEHAAVTVHKLYHHTGLPMGPGARIIGPHQLPVPKHVVTRGELDASAMAQYRERVAGAELIIVDPLAAFISGANAENDNAAMRHLVDAFSLLGQEQGAPVLILGHFGKPTTTKEGGEHTRATYASRGASSAEDACTTVFYLAQDGANYVVRNRKYKGETPKPYVLTRNPATMTHTLLTSNRPNKEAQAIAFRGRLDKALTSGVDKTSAVRVVAALEGISETTAWRWLRREVQLALFDDTAEDSAVTPGVQE